VAGHRDLHPRRWLLALCLAGLLLGGLPLAAAHATAPHQPAHPSHVLARPHSDTRHTQTDRSAASEGRDGACGVAWGTGNRAARAPALLGVSLRSPHKPRAPPRCWLRRLSGLTRSARWTTGTVLSCTQASGYHPTVLDMVVDHERRYQEQAIGSTYGLLRQGFADLVGDDRRHRGPHEGRWIDRGCRMARESVLGNREGSGHVDAGPCLVDGRASRTRRTGWYRRSRGMTAT
jgi:hypothetical protein